MSALARVAPQLRFPPPTAAAHSALATSRAGAVQSYATVHGNAITLRFAPADAEGAAAAPQANRSNANARGVRPRMLPLWNPLSLGACEAAVLEQWFAELATPRFTMHKHGYGTPLDAVRPLVGVLNTAYHTVYPALSCARCVPFSGSAEFTRLPHRQELNVAVTLWNEDAQPLATTTWTGPRGNFGGGPLGVLVTAAQAEREAQAMARADTSFLADLPSAVADDSLVAAPQAHLSRSLALADAAADDVAAADAFLEAAFGDCLPAANAARMVATANGGLALRFGPRLAAGTASAHAGMDPVAALAAAAAAAKRAAPDGGGGDGSPAMLSVAAHDACMCAFAAAVWKARVPVRAAAAARDAAPRCRIVSKVATFGLVAMSEPFELRCAPPRFSASLLSKPWEHSTGQPLLRGEPCLAMRIETVQAGAAVAVGTYFFSLAG
jgi:hypothetical protein